MIVAIMTTALAGTAWAETVYYTLDGTQTGGTNGYATESEITQNDITWMVTGNTTMNPWRIGGKGNASRPIYSISTLSQDITKVVVTNGTANLTVNSMTLVVSSNSDFSNPTSTISGTWAASNTTTFERPSGADWSNKYFKLIYDVSASTSSNQYAQLVKVEFYYNAGGTPTCATPTFSPDAGSYTSAQNVTISTATSGATIYYTTDGTTPTTSSSVYSSAIPVSTTTTIKAIATATGYDNSSVASATYTIVTLEHAGTEADPYTVADARAAIDAGIGTTGVYATGIVSEIVQAWDSGYKNISFKFVDTEGDTDFLEAYRCVSTDAADASTVAVGDVVVVLGNLTKYNTTYEFASGCQLVSLTKAAVAVEAPTFSPIAGTYAEAQTVTISTTTSGATIYYTTDGTEPTTSSNVYNTGSVVSVSSTTTIKAIAVKGSNESSVATATYFICSATNPYTVTQALAFESYQMPTSEIYVSGIVSTAPTAAPNNNGQLTYYISVDGEATNELMVYRGKGLEQAAFTAQDDIQVGDIVTIYGNVQVYNGTIEFGTGNYLVSFERPQSTDPVIVAADATIAYDVTYYELMYSIDNPVEGTELTASTTASWITSVTPSTKSFDRVMIECEANEGTEARTATIVLTYGDVTKEVTLTQEAYVEPEVDYVTLPYSWAGGVKAELLAEIGVTANGLGTDYAESNAPYRVKFDTTGDYIQFKTNERPGVVTIGVKMLGGSAASSIKVQESANGETFSELQTLSISGSQNAILTLTTTTAFAETSRYVRLYFNKGSGSNVGVGPISIAQYGDIVLNDYRLIVLNPDNATITATYGEDVLTNAEEADVTEGTEISVVVNPADGYDFESLTIAELEGEQIVTPTESNGVYTFTMPAYNVTINATVVEHVEPVTADYVLATSITSGKRYVIASGTEEGTVQVMGDQANNNRPAVAATITNGVLKVSEEYEFVIETANAGEVSGYSIYDEDADGYLYAASSGSNYLRTEAELDENNNGIWAITFGEGGVASIVAQGSYTRNVMQYNSTNSLFSCYGSASQKSVYLFEKVETEEPITVTVGSALYTTFVAPANVSFPNDVTAYIVTSMTDTSIHLEEIKNVPEDTPVIVKATAAGTYTLTPTDEIDDVTDNMLLASNGNVTGGKGIYALSKQNDVVGFYPVAASVTIPAGKAYLNTGADVKGYVFDFDDDATGIENLNANVNLNEAIYNLAGQRLSKMQKGINIVNGKKILK